MCSLLYLHLYWCICLFGALLIPIFRALFAGVMLAIAVAGYRTASPVDKRLQQQACGTSCVGSFVPAWPMVCLNGLYGGMPMHPSETAANAIAMTDTHSSITVGSKRSSCCLKIAAVKNVLESKRVQTFVGETRMWKDRIFLFRLLNHLNCTFSCGNHSALDCFDKALVH